SVGLSAGFCIIQSFGGIVGGVLYYSKLPQELSQGKCGDGICDEFEKANPNLCPRDCVSSTVPSSSSSISSSRPSSASPKSSSENSPFGFHPGNSNNYAFSKDLGAKWSKEGLYLRWNWVDVNRDGSYKFTEATAPAKPNVSNSGGKINSITSFIMIHLEAGYQSLKENNFPPVLNFPDEYRNNPLGWQEYFWSSVVDLVKEADNYNFDLTLALNPQWAEYILQDNVKIDMVKKWQEKGHEIGFHHHPKGHPDWNGYSNASDSTKSSIYLGDVNKGFSYVKDIAFPQYVVSSTIGGLPKEYPSLMVSEPGGRIILGSGNQFDSYPQLGKIKSFEPIERKAQGIGSVLELTMRELSNVMNITPEEAMPILQTQYKNIKKGEVFGIVWHEFDYFMKKDLYIEWFDFIKSQNGEVKAMKNI
ncbi:MAG: hypothetical protein COT91_01605, partial [Candidatus Doudnabacteria bacterium CG10_big_fil_rev_8_21_14_0_10_41_10]